MNFEVTLEEMIEKILDTCSDLRIEYDGNNEDEPWLVFVNGAYECDDEADDLYRGASITDAVNLAYHEITGF